MKLFGFAENNNSSVRQSETRCQVTSLKIYIFVTVTFEHLVARLLYWTTEYRETLSLKNAEFLQIGSPLNILNWS